MAAMTDEQYERIMESRKLAWQNKEGGFRAKPDDDGDDAGEDDKAPEPVPEHVTALKEKGDAAYNAASKAKGDTAFTHYQEAIDVRANRSCHRVFG